MKEKLLKAINAIDFDNMCERQEKTLKKALVMLSTKWENYKAVNIKYDNNSSGSFSPSWNWTEYNYSIIEPKKTVPLDVRDVKKLLGNGIIDKRDNSQHIITNVYVDCVRCGDVEYNYIGLYNWCTFADGSPISKEVEV